MAEFQEIMKHIQRFCGSQIKCESCPVWHREDMCCKVENVFCDGELSDDLPEIEHIVMDWAEKNPEPRLPTWGEWQKRIAPNAQSCIHPCEFMSADELKKAYGKNPCYLTCMDCLDRTIPADIAEKLGIKPIGGDEDA